MRITLFCLMIFFAGLSFGMDCTEYDLALETVQVCVDDGVTCFNIGDDYFCKESK